MASKPRRNSDALQLWADSILARTPCESDGVNSIVIRGDTIYHYGSHYPMAMIERRLPKPKKNEFRRTSDGPAIAVYVNSTEWHGASGLGSSTWQVKSELTGYVKSAAASLGIPVHMVPLTSGGPVLIDNVDGDEMPIIPELDIPVCPLKNPPRDPGPKPVKSTAGCIAGATTETETFDYRRVFDFDRPLVARSRSRFVTNRDLYDSGTLYPTEHVAYVERIYYGEDRHSYGKTPPVGFTYKQCPHCAAFDVIYDRWSAIMNGGWSNPYQMGWSQYRATIDEHGSIEAWRKARRDLMALRKTRKAELAEWMTRNSMEHSLVPTRRAGNVAVPVVDPETGRVSRAICEKTLKDLATEARRRRRQQLKDQRERKAEAARRAIARAEMAERLAKGEIIEPRCMDFLFNHGVELIERDGQTCAVLYKRIGPDMGAVMGQRSFTYTVGEWAIAEDYQPTAHCGHGLHFAESVAATDYCYGPVLIECHVPVAGIIPMSYKVKAERCYVVRIITDDNNEN